MTCISLYLRCISQAEMRSHEEAAAALRASTAAAKAEM